MISLSIITINYNNKAGLLKTFESVFNQTYKHIEYIVIDGGSSDGSVEVIKNNQEKISCWISEKDNGVYHAMNKGIKKASGSYLLFLNSGDELVSKDVISKLVEGEDGNIDLVYGDLKRTFPDNSTDVVAMREFIDVETMMSWTLCHPVTLIHKRLFNEFGYYDERLKITADWAFFLKVIVQGNASQKHKKIVVTNFFMDGLSSIASNQEIIHQEREWVKSNYLSQAFVRLYKDYQVYKSFYNHPWSGYLRKVDKMKSMVKKFFKLNSNFQSVG